MRLQQAAADANAGREAAARQAAAAGQKLAAAVAAQDTLRQQLEVRGPLVAWYRFGVQLGQLQGSLWVPL